MTTIAAPATYGATVEITGDELGSFLIHKCDYKNAVLEIWLVTLTKTGNRFHWSFFTREAAEAFAVEAESTMDWSGVENARPANNSLAAEWVSGEPTKEQKAAMKNLALARGGVRL